MHDCRAGAPAYYSASLFVWQCVWYERAWHTAVIMFQPHISASTSSSYHALSGLLSPRCLFWASKELSKNFCSTHTFISSTYKICSGAVSTDLIWGGNRGLKCQNDLYLWSSTFISVSSGEWKIYGIFHSTKMWSLNKKSFSNPEFWPKLIR